MLKPCTLEEASPILLIWDEETYADKIQPAQVWDANIVDRIVILIRTMWYEISYCLSTKEISSPVPEGHYQKHIYTLQSGSQLYGGVVRDWFDLEGMGYPIAICKDYCVGESILKTWKGKFTCSAEPEAIVLPDLEQNDEYVVIPVVLATLPFNHIVLIIYERATNTLEFYDSKGYSLLDHGDVRIAGTNARLSNLFRAAYNKYCIPCIPRAVRFCEKSAGLDVK